MTSKPLRFHPQAEQEYLTALAWYRERSLIAAINFESTFEQAVRRIRESPQRWPVYVADFRKYTLRQFPFSIVYQDFSSEIVVFAVAHGRRKRGIGGIVCRCEPRFSERAREVGTRLVRINDWQVLESRMTKSTA